MESDTDRLQLLLAVGGAQIVTPAGAFVGVFDNAYADALEVEGTRPALTCRASDVSRLSLKKGVRVDVEAASYRIRRIEPDGTGMSVLVLEG